MTQTYVQPKYKMGIDQSGNSTRSACDERQQVHSGCTGQCQLVDGEATLEGVLEDHERWHAYAIAWVGGLLTSELLRLGISPANQL
jgi:hypothetical protein